MDLSPTVAHDHEQDDELPGTSLTRLPRAAVLAAADARLHAGLLGDYLDVLVDAAGVGRRLARDELDRCRALGRVAAESGAPLAAVVDLYLSATWRAWPSLPAVRHARPGDGVAALRAAGTAVLHASDDAVAAVCEGYESARQARARAEETLRRELVDDLLTGTSDVGALMERSAAFGLRLEARHVVLVARGDRRFVDGRAVARDVSATLLGRAGGRAGLLVATKDGLLVCVVPEEDAVPDVPSTGAERGKRRAAPGAVAAVAGRLAREPALTWRLGVSRVRAGAAGVRAGYEEALEAVELADRIGMDSHVVEADDLLIFQVLLRDRQPLEDLIAAVLTPLTQARGGARPLLDALEAYFGTGGVTLAAARRLHLSARALTYRLERVRTLTDHDPANPEDRYVLQTAVLGARLLGWPAS